MSTWMRKKQDDSLLVGSGGLCLSALLMLFVCNCGVDFADNTGHIGPAEDMSTYMYRRLRSAMSYYVFSRLWEYFFYSVILYYDHHVCGYVHLFNM
jgi:hypothetical protein